MRRAIEILALSQLLTFFALPAWSADDAKVAKRNGHSRTQVTIERGNKKVVVNGPSSAAASAAALATWQVKGERVVGRENALENALHKAEDRLLAYLRETRPDANWRQKDLRRYVNQMRNTKADKYINTDELTEDEKKELNGKDLFAVELELLLTSPIKEELARKLRHDEARERQWVMMKGLLGVLALLATIGIYYRLDDRTKGYYTNMLRLGALAVLGGAGLWDRESALTGSLEFLISSLQ